MSKTDHVSCSPTVLTGKEWRLSRRGRDETRHDFTRRSRDLGSSVAGI